MNLTHLFFGLSGRISRSSFWIAVLVIVVIDIAASWALGVPLFPEEMSPFPVRLRDFAIELIILYPMAAILMKRLHDRGYAGLHAAWLLGPVLVIMVTTLIGLTGDPKNTTWLDYALGLVAIVVGLAFLIDLGFRRGEAGANEFGPDPLGAQASG